MLGLFGSDADSDAVPRRYSDSGDEDRNEKVANYPAWVKSPNLALNRQQYTNPDELFGPMPPLSMKGAVPLLARPSRDCADLDPTREQKSSSTTRRASASAAARRAGRAPTSSPSTRWQSTAARWATPAASSPTRPFLYMSSFDSAPPLLFSYFSRTHPPPRLPRSHPPSGFRKLVLCALFRSGSLSFNISSWSVRVADTHTVVDLADTAGPASGPRGGCRTDLCGAATPPVEPNRFPVGADYLVHSPRLHKR